MYYEEMMKHKEATGCSTDQLLRLACLFIEKLDDDGDLPHTANLFQDITDELSRLPGVIDVNHYHDPRFTNADRDHIIKLVMEEVGDCSIKDLAHEQIAQESLLELIVYACPDPDSVVAILLADDDDTVADLSEDLTQEDIDSYANFAHRMELMNDGGATTDLGREFIARFG